MSSSSPTAGVPRLPSDLPERLRVLRDTLLTGLVERDVAVRLALLAALAGEHLLLLGPPGTAKSLVARRLRLAFGEAPYFERLLTRFTVPEELFGPLSIRGLERDEYVRLTSRYLPTATIAFLDEIFKANSAILNALLTLLNERLFDNGADRTPTPLVAVIGASNELPEGEELEALFDRFLLRLHVGPVSDGGFGALLDLRGEATPEVPPVLRLSPELLAEVQGAVRQVEVPADVVALLKDLRAWCAAEQVPVSDRRWRKIVRLLQTSALTNGRTTVSVWDGWLLQHCVGDAPEDRERVFAWYAERVGATAALDASKLTRIVTRWEAQLKVDRESRSQVQDVEGRPLYAGPDGQPTPSPVGDVHAMRGQDKLYLIPPSATGFAPSYMRSHGVDRTNGGRGHTEAELAQQRVADAQRGYVAFATWTGRKAYLADRANWLTARGNLAPLMAPTRHKPAHIADCLGQIDRLRQEVEGYRTRLAAHRSTLERDIRGHVWVTPDFVGPATQHLDRVQQEVDALRSRIDAVREGFRQLPVEGTVGAGAAQRSARELAEDLRAATAQPPVPPQDAGPVKLVLRELLDAAGGRRVDQLGDGDTCLLGSWCLPDGETVEAGDLIAELVPNDRFRLSHAFPVFAPTGGTLRVHVVDEAVPIALDDVLGVIEPLGHVEPPEVVW